MRESCDKASLVKHEFFNLNGAQMGIYLNIFQFENIIKEMLGWGGISYCGLQKMEKEVVVLSIKRLNFP